MNNVFHIYSSCALQIKIPVGYALVYKIQFIEFQLKQGEVFQILYPSEIPPRNGSFLDPFSRIEAN